MDYTESNDLTQIVKGKRTKRPRLSSPASATTTSSLSSGGGGNRGSGDHVFSIQSYGETSESTITDEEEDMANCLILLAQSGGPRKHMEEKLEKFHSRKLSEISTIAKNGFCVYECKTCHRTFPSFQALGGHRASHKKLKTAMGTEDLKNKQPQTLTTITSDDHHQYKEDQKTSPSTTPSPVPAPGPLSLQLTTTKSTSLSANTNKLPKIHECSICGLEFMSGQALGGHMRRHRTSSATAATTTSNNMVEDQSHGNSDNKPRNVLSLDLNLPAPEDDRQESNYLFPNSSQKSLVFSTAALVDCHY
ncbi:hypothetical protein RJ641_008427 [Dillenia turbinata]|uniref:C2H2-type domain-containing protein n=1 Tax=Dillenia turbinata TaxID=194707 RepID=A0AAN8V1C6_9MAGN